MPEHMDFLLDLLDQRPNEAWQWRFEPGTCAFSPIDAVALGNAALLAYSPPEDVSRYLGKWTDFDLGTLHSLRRAPSQSSLAIPPRLASPRFQPAESHAHADPPELILRHSTPGHTSPGPLGEGPGMRGFATILLNSTSTIRLM